MVVEFMLFRLVASSNRYLDECIIFGGACVCREQHIEVYKYDRSMYALMCYDIKTIPAILLALVYNALKILLPLTWRLRRNNKI